MPIVFVHGVATRATTAGYERSWEQTRAFLRRYVAPVIGDRPEDVAIEAAYWGDVAGAPTHGGLSRPRGPLLGMGAEDDPASAAMMAEFSVALAAAEGASVAGPGPGGRLRASGPSVAGEGTETPALDALSPTELSDVLVTAMPPVDDDGDEAERAAAWAVAADLVAHDPETPVLLAGLDGDQQIGELVARVEARYDGPGAGLAGQGAASWRSAWESRLTESLSRVVHAPGFALSRAMAEVRGPLNDAVTLFFGDVFVYLAARGEAGAPGAIPARVLTALRRADAGRLTPDEPMVLVTHSMGGQIAYDLVTSILPAEDDAERLRIDFWCATASQVGLFAELRLFLDSKAAGDGVVPRPDRATLGHWWNVWDHNDFLSYSAAGIVDGVDDESYSSGLSVLNAHGGYLRRPTFFRRFADKLATAGRAGYGRTGP
jgi:hypothetical protein